ncbi:MAG: hypothetical protein AAF213_00715 [Pseudomonadota bacterium]
MSEPSKVAKGSLPYDDPMTAEDLGQTASDRPFDGDWVKQRRLRNWAILALVAAICVMFYFITMIRIEQGAQARIKAQQDAAQAAAARAAIEQAITPHVSTPDVSTSDIPTSDFATPDISTRDEEVGND